MTKTAKAQMKQNAADNRQSISAQADADRLREYARKIRNLKHFRSIQ